MSGEGGRFYGKYRGQVTGNTDPLGLGRITAKVPAVLGEVETGWALPCAPYAGSGVGFYAVPPVGANVWIEFEAGLTDVPIWAGAFWGTGEVPKAPALPNQKVFKTDAVTLTIMDIPGSFTIETTAGQKIEITPAGIEINNGMGGVIKMTGPQVSVNNGALDVM